MQRIIFISHLLQPFCILTMVHLSGVVAGCAAIFAMAAHAFRRTLPLPLTMALWHASATGFLVAMSATELLGRHTTWLLGKQDDGHIHPLSLTLLYPYHVGLRAKLAIQRLISDEAIFDRINDL